jgi:general secretion pathway protein I
MIRSKDKHDGLVISTPHRWLRKKLKFKARESRVARRTHSTPQRPRDEAQRRNWVFYEAITHEGFTLLEVLVALGIMAIVLVSVYRLHSQTISMATETRFHVQAPLLARGALARLEESRPRGLVSDEGDFGKEFPGYRWKIGVADAPSPALGAELSKDLKRIDVTVSLNDGAYTYDFRTYRLDRR